MPPALSDDLINYLKKLKSNDEFFLGERTGEREKVYPTEKYAAVSECRKNGNFKPNPAAIDRRDPSAFYDHGLSISNYEFAREIRKELKNRN